MPHSSIEIYRNNRVDDFTCAKAVRIVRVVALRWLRKGLLSARRVRVATRS